MRITIGKWPLAIKLWGAFVALTLLIFALLAVLLPWTLKGYFTEQLYDILLDTQSGLQVNQGSIITTSASNIAIRPIGPLSTTQVKETQAQEASPGLVLSPTQGAASIKSLDQAKPTTLSAVASMAMPVTGPAIQHFTISGTGQATATISASGIAPSFVQAMEQDAFAQSALLQKYTKNIDDRSIFYVIRKDLVEGKPSFMVSYAWGNYRNDLVMTMFVRLMLLMVALILVSWLPCLAIARYFTRPLIQMERHVGRLAERDWHEPLESGRRDEMGRLAKAIETMRQQLVRQDHAQQFFLQHTSHELKTPVMVIRSYAQSIQDGIFPKGSLKESLNVIMKESERLEKRIRNLLLLNKLNYLTAREKPFQSLELHEVIHDVVERLRYRRPEIQWEINVEPDTGLTGDPEQWKVALENILDNQLRYAETCIQIDVKSNQVVTDKITCEQQLPTIQIKNDGPPLDIAMAEILFEPFRSGGDGQFGLGLAIVKQIVEHHGMCIRARNEPRGVAFYIEPADGRQAASQVEDDAVNEKGVQAV